jgi:COP9 signalosome complex subunit 6
LPEFVSLQKQAINFYNDNAILLALHPEEIASGSAGGGKLPVTVYESVVDAEPKDDGSMQVDGQETSDIKFRQVPYSIDTDETEMIAINYVAKGAGSAAAVDDAAPVPAAKPVETPPSDKKMGKKRADPSLEVAETKETNDTEDLLKALTPEEEDQVAGITTRLNSVKMLQSRLALLRTFIQSLPPSHLSAATTEPAPLTFPYPDPSHLPHLRNIQALLTRLSLLTPPTESISHPLASSYLSQSNDVSNASILSLLGQEIQSLSDLGRKFSAVEANRTSLKAKQQGIPHNGGGPRGGGAVGGPMGGGAAARGGESDGGLGGAGPGGSTSKVVAALL